MQVIRQLRKIRCMTMKELGNLIGVSATAISYYETDKREPDIATLKKIAKVFDVTVDELIYSSIIESEHTLENPTPKGLFTIVTVNNKNEMEKFYLNEENYNFIYNLLRKI